jgi:GT2 family glycosyltransferase
MKFDITGSIVLYKNNPAEVNKAIRSFLNPRLSAKLYLIDNSPTDLLRTLNDDERIEYVFNKRNVGFGRAHNIALRKAITTSKYHLVLNPDVFFDGNSLESMVDMMEKDENIGLAIPRVLDFESTTQYVCKRLPAPLDLIIRRIQLIFISKIFQKRLNRYEMRDKDYSQSFEAPSLSGCFMLFRTEALRKVGFFDERFFMYMEDVDLSRRVHNHFKTWYYPSVHIVHGHARESYRLNKQLLTHIHSAIKYFNKWGWFFDKEREELNT